MNEAIITQLDEIIVGKSLNDLVPVFAGYLANMGFFGAVPRDVLKHYVNEVIDAHYAAHSAPSTEHIQ
jgi:hypothetical protein